jgi:hypothetical protein
LKNELAIVHYNLLLNIDGKEATSSYFKEITPKEADIPSKVYDYYFTRLGTLFRSLRDGERELET